MIRRTYQCEQCFHRLEVELSSDQWDDPPPECPMCAVRLQQEFVPIAIGGSNRVKATDIAEDIISNDYHVADVQREHRPQGVPKVRYKDQSPAQSSSWGAAQQALEHAMALGRQTRLKHGSGLDVLQANLKSGAEPDLIEASKRRAIRVY